MPANESSGLEPCPGVIPVFSSTPGRTQVSNQKQELIHKMYGMLPPQEAIFGPNCF